MVDENAIAADLWCSPGAGYSYATAGVHLVSMMIRRVTGNEMQQYIAERIAKPLGWGEWGFGYRRPEIRHTPGGGGIEVRAKDMIRFGEMLLREGNWNGTQIVPREYVRMCSRRSPFNPHSPYSLQFDVSDRAFWKHGSGGHCIYVVPARELVIWKLGGRDDQYGFERGEPFTPAVEPQLAAARTLELVLEAVP
jgi:CubicO group peptidase (beta-lactamase class C family)